MLKHENIHIDRSTRDTQRKKIGNWELCFLEKLSLEFEVALNKEYGFRLTGRRRKEPKDRGSPSRGLMARIRVASMVFRKWMGSLQGSY